MIINVYIYNIIKDLDEHYILNSRILVIANFIENAYFDYKEQMSIHTIISFNFYYMH
jgi:hypothetical protein